MKEMGYGADYKYPHSYPGNFVEQDYLPHEIRDKKFWNACQKSAGSKNDGKNGCFME